MTTERIDHAAEARHYLEHSDVRPSEGWPVQTGEHKADVIARAQVHATLALVEQQRIANLIALGQAGISEGLDVLMARPEGVRRDSYPLRTEVAVALGIQEVLS